MSIEDAHLWSVRRTPEAFRAETGLNSEIRTLSFEFDTNWYIKWKLSIHFEF